MQRSLSVVLLVLTACAGPAGTRDPSAADAALAIHEDAPGARVLFRDRPPGETLRLPAGLRIRPPDASEPDAGVLVLEDLQGVTLDLGGVTLRGTEHGTDLDRNVGIGIVLRRCRDVTVRGGELGGYKVCIAAFDCDGLTLDGVRFDGWYGQRLSSTTQAEDPADWLWPHANDEREWMTNYGGAIALEDCRGTTIRGARGRRGQNGILLTRCVGTRVYDCDFSFLSGWGLALYRTGGSLVARNRFDYCVRGYSHGRYWRGQDSAGILMFERCSDNVFAENSATHGGDGVFLFAGRDTVEGRAFERGEMDAGGSDRNVWWRNDFSYAVANAIEATFSSDNWAIENLLDGSHQHGVWGGYSRRMVVLANSIRGTIGGGVSIEHGQECAIVGNAIEGSDAGLELWWDEDPELVGGPFGRHRDTSSRDHFVSANRFAGNAQDLVLTRTTGVVFGANEFAAGTRALTSVRTTVLGEPGGRTLEPRVFFQAQGALPSGTLTDSTLRRDRATEPAWLVEARAWTPPELPGTRQPFARDRGARQGLDTIVMGAWGPWDFESGEPRPVPRTPGGLLSGAAWSAVWFRWNPDPAGSGSDPRGQLERWRALAAAPVAEREVGPWTDPWAGDADVRRTVGAAHFGLIARTQVTIAAAGRHRLSVVSDDGVRVIVDGVTALENWTWHGPTRDVAEIDLSAGEHTLVLEYFQIDGAAALSLDLSAIGP